MDRFLRAVSHYGLALRNWRRGYEILSVEHLFIAAETLKIVALRQAVAASGKTEDEVGLEWGIRPGESRSRTLVEAEARKRFVFHDDADLDKAVTDMSDGFEHGYADVGSLLDSARATRDAAAHHVRLATIELLGATDAANAELAEDRYAEPVDLTSFTRYVRGRILGDKKTSPRPASPSHS